MDGYARVGWMIRRKHRWISYANGMVINIGSVGNRR